MSTFKVDTLQSTTGGAVTLTGQSAAKATCSFYHSGGTPTIIDSTNVSSLNDQNTGTADVNYTSNMATSSYVTASSGWAYSTWTGAETATGSYQTSNFVISHRENGSLVDSTAATSPLNGVVFGDLA